MRTGMLVTMVALLPGAGDSQTAEGGLRVSPDKENVVASRLEGDWQLDAALNKRLTGSEGPRRGGEANPAAIAFKSDPSVTAKIPAKYEEALSQKRIYMAGILTFRRGGPKEHVFILIEHRGNPHIIWFRERDGDPLGDAESFNVMLAAAKERRNDLLFIGGDFNNQPFDAYARVQVQEKP
ncbi:MAG: hypothetical protein JXP34_08415 [Planctomycetes bacterium]|nr:hypothetical protein [Planctomycetota bacterium]